MNTSAVVQINDYEPRLECIAHFKNINDANKTCAEMSASNPDYTFVVLVLPKAK